MGGFKTGKLIYFVLASVSAMHPNRVGDGDGWYGDLHPEIKPSPDPNDVPLTKEAIRDEFKQIDTGGDGKISFKVSPHCVCWYALHRLTACVAPLPQTGISKRLCEI